VPTNCSWADFPDLLVRLLAAGVGRGYSQESSTVPATTPTTVALSTKRSATRTGNASRTFIRHIGKEIFDADDHDEAKRCLCDLPFVPAHEFSRP
jgi:hypothetical protein